MTTTENHAAFLLRAADFAARKHRDQRRKDPEASPYINHPIAVARLLSEVGGIADAEILAAALLHDTIEDTETTGNELEAEFGPRVRSLVEDVTDDKSLEKAERKRRQAEHASTLGPDSVAIKLGDKIANVRDVSANPPSGWSNERRREYLDWAESVIDNCREPNPALLTTFRGALAAGRKTIPD